MFDNCCIGKTRAHSKSLKPRTVEELVIAIERAEGMSMRSVPLHKSQSVALS